MAPGLTALAFSFTHRYASGVEVQASLTRPLGEGSLLVIYGPSGSGKSTVLRALAGLIRPAEGRIAFGDRVWFDSTLRLFEPPQMRRVGYVAQDAALFPHLTVRENIAYGLRDVDTAARKARIAELAALVKLDALLDRFPRALSGGQAQRVALARAIAPRPDLLLLDEPFGALDGELRRTLRADLRHLVQKTGSSAVLVTHDRVEAMVMGDALAVMVDGRIRQTGPLTSVFQHPHDSTIARALGVETVLPAMVDHVSDGLVTLRIGSASLVAVAEGSLSPGDEVYACIRAADVVVERRGATSDSARNHVSGVVTLIEHEGVVDRLTIACGFDLVAAVTSRSRHDLGLTTGSEVAAAIKATAIHVVLKT